MFKYKDYIFYPIRKFTKKETLNYVSRHISTEGVFLAKRSQVIHTAVDDWNHDEFYEASGGSRCDVFECNERPGLWVPCDNYLARYEG